MRTNRISLTVFGLLAGFVANSAIAKIYDCHLRPPQALFRDGKKLTLKTINFPDLKDEPWKFRVEIKTGQGDKAGTAIVQWPSNPIQIAGEFPVLKTANGAIAFTSADSGPCMFTVSACFTLVQIADQEPGNAKISVLPTALWTDRAINRSDPFVAILEGTCTWKDS